MVGTKKKYEKKLTSPKTTEPCHTTDGLNNFVVMLFWFSCEIENFRLFCQDFTKELLQ